MRFYYNLMSKIYNVPKYNGSLLVLMYHEVQKDNIEIESWTVVKQSEFEKQMIYLMKCFTIVSLDEALKLISTKNPLTKNYVVITFDDGYSGNYEVVYPFITKHTIPIAIYVATRACKENILYWYDEIIEILQGKKDYFIDLRNFNNKTYRIKASKSGENKWTMIQEILEDLKKLKLEERGSAVKAIVSQLHDDQIDSSKLSHLTVNEIKELSESPLVTIGAHSHCHNLLPSITYDMALNSIIESKQLLEKWISESVIHFSYPNGDYDANIVDILKQSGFNSSMTTRPGYWQRNDSLFEIPRLGIGRYDSIDKFKYIVMRPK